MSGNELSNDKKAGENVDELSGLFVEKDRFSIESDDSIEEEGIKALLFYAKSVIDQEQVICKVYDPKLLQEDQLDNPNDKTSQGWYRQLMLMREIIFLKKLRHPTIVDIKGINLFNNKIIYDPDINESDRNKYTNPTVFLEFLSKKSLQNILITNKESLLPVERQIIMIGLAAAVRYIHSKKVFHRSLNPLTIWLDENYYPKLFDFSSSRDFNPKKNDTFTVINEGSVFYQSPEIMNPSNSGDYKNPVDIYSLGRLFYLLITTYEPFQYPNHKEKCAPVALKSKIPNNPNFFPYFPDDMPQCFQDLLKKCWSINPSERPSAAEIYYNLTQREEYRIPGLDIDNDIPKIDAYVKMIEDYESQPKGNLRMFMNYSLHIPLLFGELPDKDIPEVVEQQKQMLALIVNSNYGYCSEETTFKLLFTMADNGSIFTDYNILQIIDYVSSKMNNEKASLFIKKVFGEYIVSNEVTTIRKGEIDNNITVANIPPWVEKISDHAFSEFKNLKRVYVPNSVKEIGVEAFSDCSKLKLINLPDSVTGNSIGKFAFQGCESLVHVKLPEKLVTIQEGTFKNAKSLKYVTLNNELEVIGKEAFAECRSIEAIVIPKEVKIISDRAFYHCRSLESVLFRSPERPAIGKKAIFWTVSKQTIAL